MANFLYISAFVLRFFIACSEIMNNLEKSGITLHPDSVLVELVIQGPFLLSPSCYLEPGGNHYRFIHTHVNMLPKTESHE